VARLVQGAVDAAPRSQAEVLAAVVSLHPDFEVPDSRFAVFTQAGEAQLLADNACCGPFIFGPPAPDDWRTLDLSAHRVHTSVAGADDKPRYSRDGIGSAALGDPRTALTWLANDLSARGITLRAGEFVSTGTCMVPLEIQPGDRVRADYGALGVIDIRLGA
jgi:2-keto-4-pentenoate hydratase